MFLKSHLRGFFYIQVSYRFQLSDTPPVPWSKNNHDWSKIDSEQLNTAEEYWGGKGEKKENVQVISLHFFIYRIFNISFDVVKCVFATKLKGFLFYLMLLGLF